MGKITGSVKEKLTRNKIDDELLKSEDDDFPVYRKYGVTRREYPMWEKIKLTAFRIALIIVFIPLFIAPCACILAFYLFFPELWIKLLVTILAAIIIACRATRTLRKRRKFCKELKKLAKRKNYRLNFDRNFNSSFSWASEGVDFTLDTGRCMYYVRYLTMKKYNASLYFEDKDEIKLVKHHLKNRFTTAFDLKSKVSAFPTNFDIKNAKDNCKCVKVILVNPVCKDMFYKDKDGSRVATGNGAELFGYTIYTGSGFIEAVQRANSNRYKYE